MYSWLISAERSAQARIACSVSWKRPPSTKVFSARSVCRAGTGDGGDRIHLVFADLNNQTDGAQDLFDELLLLVLHGVGGGDGEHALAHGRGGVRHTANNGLTCGKALGEGFEGHASSNGYHDSIRRKGGCDIAGKLNDAVGLHSEQHDVCVGGCFVVAVSFAAGGDDFYLVAGCLRRVPAGVPPVCSGGYGSVRGGRVEAYPSSLAGAGGLGHTEPMRESRELMRRPRGRGSCCHPKPGFRVAPVAEAQKARA